MKDYERLANWLHKALPDDADKFDLEAEYDSELTYDENKTIIESKVKPLMERQITKQEIKAFKDQQEHKAKKPVNQAQAHWIVKEVVHKSKISVILGKRGSGKTALGFHGLELHHQLGDRPVYTYKFPKPSLLPKWIKNCTSLKQLPRHSVALIDESGIEFNQFSFNKQNSREVSDMIKIARHKDISLIFCTQNGNFLTADIKRLVDTYLLREPSLSQLYDEKGIIKKLYEKCQDKFNTPISKQKGYFLVDGSNQEFMYFDLPSFWTDEISKAYGIVEDDEATNTSTMMSKLKTKMHELSTFLPIK